MEKDGDIARPGSSRQSSFTDSPSMDTLYPPPTSQQNGNGATVGKIFTPSDAVDVPKFFGLPLKYVSLVTLALQSTTLVIVMHYSRVSVSSSSNVYSASSAVLIVEVLKCAISLVIAFIRTKPPPSAVRGHNRLPETPTYPSSFSNSGRTPYLVPAPVLFLRIRQLASEIGSADAWKLSIPALLYVLQNNLQYVAVSNLDVPTFQVTNQMKILTTAGFSVMLLHRKLSKRKWISLALLAIGVGIVQIQASTSSVPVELPSLKSSSSVPVAGGDTVDPPPSTSPTLHPLTGFLAVTASCFTSGLAGVYFEMVLKGSTADLWVRNVQMSAWSIIPALVPILVGFLRDGTRFEDMFANFGAWAWCTVLMQVLGGLVTALVIKYSDNILKGFATSLAIVLSFLVSVGLFNLSITISFLVGASVVLGATWMYNASEQQKVSSYKSQESEETSALYGEDNKNIRLSNQDDNSKYNGSFPETNGTNGRVLAHVKDVDHNGPALISPIEAHEPLLGHPGYSSGR